MNFCHNLFNISPVGRHLVYFQFGGLLNSVVYIQLNGEILFGSYWQISCALLMEVEVYTSNFIHLLIGYATPLLRLDFIKHLIFWLVHVNKIFLLPIIEWQRTLVNSTWKKVCKLLLKLVRMVIQCNVKPC